MHSSWLNNLWYEPNPGLLTRVTRGGLAPFSWGYRATQKIVVRGQPKRVDCPVISVGNLTVGGNGKTPLVIFLSKYLQSRGKKVVVVSRGYGRKSKGVRIVGRPEDDSVAQIEDAGDEPVLIASRLPEAGVVVGESRVEACEKAIAELKPDVIICDDAFQHRGLYRDLDIVAVHARFGFGNRKLLPAGPLREPMAGLQRAGLIVFTYAKDSSVADLQKRHNTLAGIKAVAMRFMPDSLVCKNDLLPAKLGENTPVLACCSVAHPEGFLSSCKKAGLNVVASRFFPDHHNFSPSDLLSLEKHMATHNAKAVVTTEKDLVRGLEMPEAIPVYALRISGVWSDPFSQRQTEKLLEEIL